MSKEREGRKAEVHKGEYILSAKHIKKCYKDPFAKRFEA